MQFGLAQGGTLTGTATAASAAFSGSGSWIVSSATINLTQGLTDLGALQITGGTLTGGGAAAIGAAGGAGVSVSNGAQVSFLSDRCDRRQQR